MRFFFPQPARSILPLRFFREQTVPGALLLRGLPILGCIIFLVFLAASMLTQLTVQRAISRNSQLQAQAMAHAVENVLRETRNQLLILAAGTMDATEMNRRLYFRSQSSNTRYREVAFLGVDPEKSFLLVNYEGEILSLPLKTVNETRNNPFQHFPAERRAGCVVADSPLEVTYTMVSVGGNIQNITLYVQRMFTPIYDANGDFQGMLILSLDLNVLRDALSLFESNVSPMYDDDSKGRLLHSFFFDPQGWVLFQSEKPGAHAIPLSTDMVRSGLKGDFGQPGLGLAFRPSAEHEHYWKMVTKIQNGETGRTSLENALIHQDDGNKSNILSFAPVRFQEAEGREPRILGGIAISDANKTAAISQMYLLAGFGAGCLAALGILGVTLFRLGRHMVRPFQTLTSAIREAVETPDPVAILHPSVPAETAHLRDAVNLLLERIHILREETRLRQYALHAEWQRQPVEHAAIVFPEQGIVGSSEAVCALRGHIRKAALVFADVLICGETGTGKEVAANAIHNLSDRASGPFISINCGALDENLLMDTLFGHVKGAFTEARSDRPGAFISADGGTLLLDEVGNASPKVQQSLLRALATRRIRPLGSDSEIAFDTRIIAATNVDLLKESRNGKFREDLYYRLAVITIDTPPLRTRKDDILSLSSWFLNQAADDLKHPPAILTRGALERLMEYDWPGNVRELKNTLTRAIAFIDGEYIYAENIVFGDSPAENTPGNATGAQEKDYHETFWEAGRHPETNVPPSPATDTPSAQELLPVHTKKDFSRLPRPFPPSVPTSANEERETDLPHASHPGTPDILTPSNTPPAFQEAAAPVTSGESTSPVSPDSSLNRRQQEILRVLETAASITRQEYQELTGENISTRTAQYDLQDLVRRGLLHKEGRGPASRYRRA